MTFCAHRAEPNKGGVHGDLEESSSALQCSIVPSSLNKQGDDRTEESSAETACYEVMRKDYGSDTGVT